jgi:predicted N-acetyltransferase YhbS
MREVRRIQAQEADRFLRLLCRVFDLDHGRAHSIFFSEPLFDLSRKWALFEGDQIVSILTTVPLEFGWGKGVGIAGVATELGRQGEGLAHELLHTVIQESLKCGESGIMLFAKDTRLYNSVGFEVIDEVVRGPILGRPELEIPPGLDFDRVRTIYDQWSRADQNRLRRGDLRWKYWKWNLRVCTPFLDGYLCFEGGVVREVVVSGRRSEWVVPVDSEWLGLSTMVEQIGAKLGPTTTELTLMGYGVPDVPQFFMTDQF